MLTTEETKRMAAIMFSGAPKTKKKAEHIVRQLLLLPDAIRVDFDEVKAYLYELVENETRKPTKTKLKRYRLLKERFENAQKDFYDYVELITRPE